MRKVATLRRNRDGTLTLKVGRAIEHFTLAPYEGLRELEQKVRFALYSKDVVLAPRELRDLVSSAVGGY